jgi:hypothetical protein
MIGLKKSVILMSFFLVLLLISFVNSAQTIQVQPETQPIKEGWASKYFGFLKSPLFWGILIFIILFVLIAIGLVFFISWLIRFFKERSDIYMKLKKERITLSKIQKRYPSTHFWRVEKNLPIRLVKKSFDGKIFLTEPIGFYRGDYTTQEGNIIISMNLKGKKKFFLFPMTDVLIIPDREKIEIEQEEKGKGEKNKITINNLPRAKDLVQFNPNEILIYAESLSYCGIFLTPVIRTKDNKIMDLSLPVFQSLKEVVMNEYLYFQANEFSALSKQAMNLNPQIRAIIKTGDSQNVDIPTGEEKR